MSEKEQEQPIKKKRNRIDKSQIIIRIVATILALAMVLPIVASVILYFVGD